MDYINEYTIKSMMSKTSFQDGVLIGSRGFYRSASKRIATVFGYPLDNEEGFDEIKYMNMYAKPYGIHYNTRYEVSWIIDNSFLPGNLGMIKSKSIRHAARKYSKTVDVSPFSPEDIDDLLLMIDEWDRQSGKKYIYLNHSYRDREFFRRLSFGEIDQSPYICYVFRINGRIVGYSASTKVPIEQEHGMNVYVGFFKKNLTMFDGEKMLGLSEYINWFQLSKLLQIDGGESIIFNVGASSGGVLKHQKSHFPIYSIEKRYFYTKIFKEEAPELVFRESPLSVRETVFIRLKAGNFVGRTVAKEIGVKQSALSSYIYGREPLPYDALEKLCIVLGLGFKIGESFVCEEDMFRKVFTIALASSGMKTKDFAKKTGINYSSISLYLHGKRDFSNKNIEKAFDLLNLHLTTDG